MKLPSVVLFGHEGCPGTMRAREYLHTHGISFKERSPADPDAREQMRRWGAWATPLLVIDDRFRMIGFEVSEFERLLAQAQEAEAPGTG